FRPIRGYVAPQIHLSAEALPLRPNRGIFVVVTSTVDDPSTRPAFERRNRWYDQVGVPALVEREGVAGGWTFNSEESLTPAAWAHREQRQSEPEGDRDVLRLTVLFLDGDPLTTTATIGLDDILAPDASDLETIRFAGPLEAIEPWSYDWFEQAR